LTGCVAPCGTIRVHSDAAIAAGLYAVMLVTTAPERLSVAVAAAAR